MLRFDHVIAAVPDLDVAGDLVRSTFGWGTVGHGRHPGGTQNTAIPLGGEQYLELLAVYDDALPTGADVARHLSGGPGWFGWVVQDDDLDGTAAHLGLTVREGSIETADGRRGTWRIAGWEEARASGGGLPFFIDYGADRAAERAAVWADRYLEAAHLVAPVGIAWIAVGLDESTLRRSLGDANLDVRATSGKGLRAVGIRLEDGRVVEVDDQSWGGV